MTNLRALRQAARSGSVTFTRREALYLAIAHFAASTFIAAPALAMPGHTLFVICRSNNRNTVYFDLSRETVDPAQPLYIYWRLFQEDGRTEPLSWLERKLAYGYEVTHTVKRDVIQVTFNACSARPIEIHRGSVPRAVMRINGVDCVLREVYVTADETGLIPRVHYVDLVGVTVEGGLASRERLAV